MSGQTQNHFKQLSTRTDYMHISNNAPLFRADMWDACAKPTQFQEKKKKRLKVPDVDAKSKCIMGYWMFVDQKFFKIVSMMIDDFLNFKWYRFGNPATSVLQTEN